jgi:hypothetical protein
VTILANDELMFSRRCLTEAEACYVAKSWKQDTERGGFVAVLEQT